MLTEIPAGKQALDDDGARPQKARQKSLWRDLAQTAVLTVVIFLAVRVMVQNFRVEGESMMPNFHNNEYILVNKISYRFGAPQRGDVIVFRAVPADQPDHDFIKRIVGVPGDRVAVKNRHVYVNGRQLSETYIQPAYRPDYVFTTHVVPPGDYFVLGDNRNNSFDSSKWFSTWLPKSDIIGKAWLAYWPPSDVHLMNSPSYNHQ